MNSKEKIIKKFIEAYNSFDIDTMLLLLHSEVQFKNISGGEIGESEYIFKDGSIYSIVDES